MKKNDIKLVEKEISEDALEYEALDIKLDHDQIIRPFVFIKPSDDNPEEIKSVTLGYESAEPYTTVVRNINDTCMALEQVTQINKRDVIFRMGKLYSEYATNLIVSNLISVASAGFMDIIRKYSKNNQYVNDCFTGAIDSILNNLSSRLIMDVEEYIKGTLAEELSGDSKIKLYKHAEDNLGKAYPIFITGFMSSMVFITPELSDIVSKVFAADAIDFARLAKDRVKENDIRFEFTIDDSNIQRMAAHRYISIQLTNDLNELSELIEIVGANTMYKINEDIDNNHELFIKIYKDHFVCKSDDHSLRYEY